MQTKKITLFTYKVEKDLNNIQQTPCEAVGIVILINMKLSQPFWRYVDI